MNCDAINAILDDREPEHLSRTERLEVEAHLQTCVDCAAAWSAQTRMHALRVPAMPARLERQCRQLLVSVPASTKPARRSGLLVLGGLLLVGAAAAALIGTQWAANDRERADAASAGAAPAAAPAGPEDTPAIGQRPGIEPEQRSASVGTTASVSQPAEADSSFTVALTPPRNLATTGLGAAAGQSVYEILLEELRKLPNLDLIELEARPDEDATPGQEAALTVEPPGPAGANRAYGSRQVLDISGTEPPSLRLVAPPGTAEKLSGGAESPPEAKDGGGTDLNFIPSALIDRIETVRGGASATFGDDPQAGVVNVILDRSPRNISNITIANVTMTASAATTSSPAVGPLGYDLLLDTTTRMRGDIVTVAIDATNGSGHIGSFISDMPTSSADEARRLVAEVVRMLRESVLPPSAEIIAETESRVLDASLNARDRQQALQLLDQLSARARSAEATEAFIAGAIRLEAESRDAEIRAWVWRILGSRNNVRLVQPLSDSLLYDPDASVRLAAAKDLGDYRGDGIAQATLESAGRSDPSPEVQRAASWLALDDQARRERVIATLLDSSLSDAERLAPITAAGDRSGPSIYDIDIGLAIDGTAASAISAMVGRIGDARRRLDAVARLGGTRVSAFVPVLLDRLSMDTDSSVRNIAATLLAYDLDEPGVRPALERAATGDPDARVRETAARSLAFEPPPSLPVP